MTVSQLGIEVKSSDAARAAVDLDHLTSSAGRAEKATDSLAGASRRQQTATEQMNREIGRAVTVNDNATASVNRHMAAIQALTAAEGRSSNRNARGDDIAAYGRALDDLRSRFNPLFAEERRHSQYLEDLNRALRVGAINTQEHANALLAESSAYRQNTAELARNLQTLQQRESIAKSMAQTMVRNQTITPDRGADIAAYGNSLDDLRAQYNPAFDVIRRYREEVNNIREAQRLGAISTDEMTAAISRQRQQALANLTVLKDRGGYETSIRGTERFTGALNDNAKSLRELSFQRRQLTFQLYDIGQSLALGMPALMVALQQGPQIAQIWGAEEGGVGRAFKETGGIIAGVVRVLGPLGVAAGVGATAVAILTANTNKARDANVSFLDTARAIGELSWEGIKDLASQILPSQDTLIKSLWTDRDTQSLNYIISVIAGAYERAKTTFLGMADVIATGVKMAFNSILEPLNWVLKQAHDGVNSLIEKFMSVPGMTSSMDWLGIKPDLSPYEPIKPYTSSDVDIAAALARHAANRAASEKEIAGYFKENWAGDMASAISARSVEISNRPDEKELRRMQRERDRQKKAYDDIIRSSEQYVEQQKLEVEAVGMGAEAAARLRYEQELLQEAARQRIDLSPKQIEALKEQASAMAEAEVATRRFMETYNELSQAFVGFFSDLRQNLTEGKNPFEAFVDSATRALNRLLDKMLEVAASQIFDSLFTAGGGGTNNLISFFTSALTKNADGNVYDSPSLSSYSNGVYDSPKLFQFAKGAGVFGEAGPEAIMPLKRGPDGKLGVSGSAGAGTVVNVFPASDAVQSVERSRGPNGEEIINVIMERVKQTIVGDFREQGDIARAAETSYNLRRAS